MPMPRLIDGNNPLQATPTVDVTDEAFNLLKFSLLTHRIPLCTRRGVGSQLEVLTPALSCSHGSGLGIHGRSLPGQRFWSRNQFGWIWWPIGSPLSLLLLVGAAQGAQLFFGSFLLSGSVGKPGSIGG